MFYPYANYMLNPLQKTIFLFLKVLENITTPLITIPYHRTQVIFKVDKLITSAFIMCDGITTMIF